MTAPAVSAIVVNWNTRELLERCLGALEQEALPLEVIVVDNGSSDGSVELVEGRFPSARLLRNADNRGYAAANNQGMAVARGRYFLLLNSDAEVEPGAVTELVRYADDRPDAGVLGAKLLNVDGSLQPSGGHAPTPWWTVAGLFGLSRTLGRPRYGTRRDYEKPAEVDEVSGAAMMIRRAVVDQIGGLDEGYTWGWEDVDFCLRARRAGWRIQYVPQARVRHIWGGTSRLLPAAATLRAIAGRQRYFRQHFGRWPSRVVMAGTVASHLLRLVVFGIASIGRPDARRRARLELEVLRGLARRPA